MHIVFFLTFLLFFLKTHRQSQVVNHTNFRIDNIMSTTRFTELPEQAQKELDELEKYIKMESQRCEYIGKQKMPKHLDAMDNARKNTEILSQVSVTTARAIQEQRLTLFKSNWMRFLVHSKSVWPMWRHYMKLSRSNYDTLMMAVLCWRHANILETMHDGCLAIPKMTSKCLMKQKERMKDID